MSSACCPLDGPGWPVGGPGPAGTGSAGAGAPAPGSAAAGATGTATTIRCLVGWRPVCMVKRTISAPAAGSVRRMSSTAPGRSRTRRSAGVSVTRPEPCVATVLDLKRQPRPRQRSSTLAVAGTPVSDRLRTRVVAAVDTHALCTLTANGGGGGARASIGRRYPNVKAYAWTPGATRSVSAWCSPVGAETRW